MSNPESKIKKGEYCPFWLGRATIRSGGIYCTRTCKGRICRDGTIACSKHWPPRAINSRITQ